MPSWTSWPSPSSAPGSCSPTRAFRRPTSSSVASGPTALAPRARSASATMTRVLKQVAPNNDEKRGRDWECESPERGGGRLWRLGC
jgi:hypothetical protein